MNRMITPTSACEHTNDISQQSYIVESIFLILPSFEIRPSFIKSEVAGDDM